jgi:hypothetical protein
MVPSQAPAVSVTPRDGQPAGTRQVKATYFTPYVPASFQEKSSPQANGEQMVMFDAPSSKPDVPVRVAVVAVGPAGEFDAAGLARIVETFRAHA